MLIDVHCHLDMLKDIDSVVDRAEEAGVKVIIANGVDPKTNRKVMELSEKYSIVKPALGIYPNDGIKMKDSDIKAELKFIEESKPIAIGECGIDYKEEVDKEKMKSLFEEHIKLAKKLDVPIIVHSRKAEQDCIELLEKHECKKVVMHCFGGKKKLVQRIIDNKWSFSIPCIVVKLLHFQDIVRTAPITQLLTETDAPWMSPYPNVEQNEPAFVVETIQKFAELKGMTVEETSNQIFMNYQKLFL